MGTSIPLARRLLYTGVVFALFLLLLEGVLALYPRLAVRARSGAGTAEGALVLITTFGDSVTYGYGVQRGEDWPRQLQARLEGMEPPAAIATMARPGAGLATVVELGIPRLKPVEPGMSSSVLLMVGHNDFLSWPENSVNPFSDAMNASAPRAAADDRPRLLRITSWALNLLRDRQPEVQVERATLEWYTEQLRAFDEAVRATGGRTFVLTYIVPGEPPPSLDPGRAEVVRTTRDAQLLCNETIRQAAKTLDVALIDVARLVDAPPEYSPDWFTDHIHPTALGHAEIAKVVHRALIDAGALPAPR